MNVRVYCRVYGRVQGVFFRASAKEYASAIGVGGWVRNMVDGSVEGIIEGEKNKVDMMIKWCKKGPAHAFVEKFEFIEEDFQGNLLEFKIKY